MDTNEINEITVIRKFTHLENIKFQGELMEFLDKWISPQSKGHSQILGCVINTYLMNNGFVPKPNETY